MFDTQKAPGGRPGAENEPTSILTKKETEEKENFNLCQHLPDPLESMAGFKKAYNLDVYDMGPVELYREELRAEMGLACYDLMATCFYDSHSNPTTIGEWLLKRLAAIRQTRERRVPHAG